MLIHLLKFNVLNSGQSIAYVPYCARLVALFMGAMRPKGLHFPSWCICMAYYLRLFNWFISSVFGFCFSCDRLPS